MRPRDKPVPSTSVEGPAVLGPARIFQEQHLVVLVVVVVVTTERERDPIDEAAPDSLKFKIAQCTSLIYGQFRVDISSEDQITDRHCMITQFQY